MIKNKIAPYLLVGFLAFAAGWLSKPEPKAAPNVVSEVKSNNISKCVVTKKTDSKGQVIEVIEANAQSDNFLHNQISSSNKETVDLFLGAGMNNSFHVYGSLEVIFGKSSLELQSDFNKDHSIFYKRKILEWE